MEAPLDEQIDPRATRTIGGRYEVRSLIGRGGAASVHQGWDLSLERSVAIKIVPADVGAPGLHRREDEAKLLASFNQRSLVTLYDAIVTPDATFLVMELMEGGTLAALTRRGPIAPDDVAAVTRDIAGALHYIHARGIVHRDVKPANVLLAGEDAPLVAKLSDFGIAKLLETAPGGTTGILGTAQYVSPEQAQGQRVGPASDVYSFGLTLIEALTGTPAFPGSATESLMARILRDPDVPRSLGYEWRSLLTAMTARDPDARPSADLVARRAQTLGSAVADPGSATAVLATQPISLRLAPVPPPPSRTRPLAVVGMSEGELPGRPVRRSRRSRLIVAGVVVAVVAVVCLLAGVLGPLAMRPSADAAASPSASARVGSSSAAPAASSSATPPPRSAVPTTPPATASGSGAPSTAGSGASAASAKAKAKAAAKARAAAKAAAKAKGKSKGKGGSNGKGNGKG